MITSCDWAAAGYDWAAAGCWLTPDRTCIGSIPLRKLDQPSIPREPRRNLRPIGPPSSIGRYASSFWRYANKRVFSPIGPTICARSREPSRTIGRTPPLGADTGEVAQFPVRSPDFRRCTLTPIPNQSFLTPADGDSFRALYVCSSAALSSHSGPILPWPGSPI